MRRRLSLAVGAALVALVVSSGAAALAQSPASLAVGSAAVVTQSSAPAVNYSSMKWHDLTPGGWDVKTIYRKFDLASMWNLDDRDPRAKALLRKLSAALDRAEPYDWQTARRADW